MSKVSTDNRYMEFRLGDQLYAFPLLSVKEVIQKPEITLVPNMPPHFEGMMNLRGQILGVYNVRKKLSAKAREKTEGSPEVIMVIEQNGVSVGIMVDEVTRVLHPDQEMMKPAPLKQDDPSKSFVSAVIQTGEELVLAVNVGELLEFDKFNPAKLAA